MKLSNLASIKINLLNYSLLFFLILVSIKICSSIDIKEANKQNSLSSIEIDKVKVKELDDNLKDKDKSEIKTQQPGNKESIMKENKIELLILKNQIKDKNIIRDAIVNSNNKEENINRDMNHESRDKIKDSINKIISNNEIKKTLNNNINVSTNRIKESPDNSENSSKRLEELEKEINYLRMKNESNISSNLNDIKTNIDNYNETANSISYINSQEKNNIETDLKPYIGSNFNYYNDNPFGNNELNSNNNKNNGSINNLNTEYYGGNSYYSNNKTHRNFKRYRFKAEALKNNSNNNYQNSANEKVNSNTQSKINSNLPEYESPIIRRSPNIVQTPFQQPQAIIQSPSPVIAPTMIKRNNPYRSIENSHYMNHGRSGSTLLPHPPLPFMNNQINLSPLNRICPCSHLVKCPPCGILNTAYAPVKCPCAPPPVCNKCPPLSLVHEIASRKALSDQKLASELKNLSTSMTQMFKNISKFAGDVLKFEIEAKEASLKMEEASLKAQFSRQEMEKTSEKARLIAKNSLNPHCLVNCGSVPGEPGEILGMNAGSALGNYIDDSKIFPQEVDSIGDYMKDAYSTNINGYNARDTESMNNNRIETESEGSITVEPMGEEETEGVKNINTNQGKR